MTARGGGVARARLAYGLGFHTRDRRRRDTHTHTAEGEQTGRSGPGDTHTGREPSWAQRAGLIYSIGCSRVQIGSEAGAARLG